MSTMVAARFASASIDVKTIGSEADVDVIVTGTLLRAGDRLQFSAQLEGS